MTFVRTWFVATLLCIAVACSAVASARAGGTDPVARYRAQVRAVSAALDASAQQLRHSPKTKLALPIVHLPPAPLGQIPTYSPSLDDWLQSNLQALRKLKTKRARARQLVSLATSLRQLAALPAASAPPPLDANQQAFRILSQPNYKTGGAGPAPQPHPSIWQRILLWFTRLFAEIFSRVFQGAAGIPLIGQILAVVLLLALLAAIGLAVYALALRLRQRAGADVNAFGQPLPPAADPEYLYARGLAAANAGRYAEAIALLFQASLAYFDSAGKVEYDAARTAGEYRRLVRRSVAPASPYFDALAGVFSVVAYAERQASAQDWSAAQGAFLALRPLVVS